MQMQEILKYVDEIVYAQTGKHLDTLQMAILKGVLDGRKYSQIAEDYHCSTGHAKDEAYELWHILSKTLGEDLDKSNFRATIERSGVANTYSHLVNPIQVGSINFCPNPEDDLSSVDDNFEQVDKKSTSDFEIAQRTIKLETIPRLIKLGLTSEQIAQALDLAVDEVQQAM